MIHIHVVKLEVSESSANEIVAQLGSSSTGVLPVYILKLEDLFLPSNFLNSRFFNSCLVRDISCTLCYLASCEFVLITHLLHSS